MQIEFVFPFILGGLSLLFLIIRGFSVLLHELGHGLLAMLTTWKGVTIYVGSHGDEKKSLYLTIKKLKIWLRYNPLLWQKGLCRHEKTSNRQTIVILLGGPLMSILIAAPACYFAFFFHSHGAVKFMADLSPR